MSRLINPPKLGLTDFLKSVLKSIISSQLLMHPNRQPFWTLIDWVRSLVARSNLEQWLLAPHRRHIFHLSRIALLIQQTHLLRFTSSPVMHLIWLIIRENKTPTKRFLSGLWVKARMGHLSMYLSISSINLFRSEWIATGMSMLLHLRIISPREFHREALWLLICKKQNSCLLLKIGSLDTKRIKW
jgi:hypothetical protein